MVDCLVAYAKILQPFHLTPSSSRRRRHKFLEVSITGSVCAERTLIIHSPKLLRRTCFVSRRGGDVVQCMNMYDQMRLFQHIFKHPNQYDVLRWR